MSLDEPDALIAAYTRKMMAFLLFNPAPKRITMVGLGGGSLAKFCYRNLPEAQITVVEIDARVVALRDEFCIPADDERLRIVCEDGAHYISQRSDPIDVLLVDAFDPIGVASDTGRLGFLFPSGETAVATRCHGDELLRSAQPLHHTHRANQGGVWRQYTARTGGCR